MCACVKNIFPTGTVDHVGKARHGYGLIVVVSHGNGGFHLPSSSHVGNFLPSPGPRKGSSTFNKVCEV